MVGARARLVFAEGKGVHVAGAVNDANDDEIVIGNAEVSAIFAMHMEAKARPHPIAG